MRRASSRSSFGSYYQNLIKHRGRTCAGCSAETQQQGFTCCHVSFTTYILYNLTYALIIQSIYELQKYNIIISLMG